MASIRRIRVVTVGMAAAAALLAMPALASAVVYCVPNDAIDASCTAGQGQGTIQAAFNAAATSTAVADTVRIDAGSYSEASLSYQQNTSTNVLTVIGDGPAQTLLTIPSTTGQATGLRISAPTGSSVSNLAMTIPANADIFSDTGIRLGGGAVFGHNLLVTGPAASNATGIWLDSGSGIDTSTVNLQFASPSNEAVLNSFGNGTITDTTLHGDYGLFAGGDPSDTVTVDRTSIQAAFLGATNDSATMDIRNSLIDLGTNAGATAVAAQNLNNGTAAIAANLDGDTIVGGGSGSVGVRALADSDGTLPVDPNDTTNDGESSTVSVANTILSGQTKALQVQADRGEVATMTTSYSNYDTATKVVTNDYTPGGGTGSAAFSESHQTNVAPGFVSTSDFHLAAGSAMIDTGDLAGPPFGSLDIDGDDRVIFGEDGCDGARRDIGADEFVPLSPPTLLDCLAPNTSILSGPSGVTGDNTPTFSFASTEPSSTFRCRIDGGLFAACSSPYTAPSLGDGPHTFAVKAKDPSLNEDTSPATRSFTVDTTAPPPPDTSGPETTIGSHPKPKTKKRRAIFTFSSSEAGASFLCSVDGKAFAPCTSPFTTPKLKRGKHRFDVLAIDAAGNQDQSAATFFWKVLKRRKR